MKKGRKIAGKNIQRCGIHQKCFWLLIINIIMIKFEDGEKLWGRPGTHTRTQNEHYVSPAAKYQRRIYSKSHEPKKIKTGKPKKMVITWLGERTPKTSMERCPLADGSLNSRSVRRRWWWTSVEFTAVVTFLGTPLAVPWSYRRGVWVRTMWRRQMRRWRRHVWFTMAIVRRSSRTVMTTGSIAPGSWWAMIIRSALVSSIASIISFTMITCSRRMTAAAVAVSTAVDEFNASIEERLIKNKSNALPVTGIPIVSWYCIPTISLSVTISIAVSITIVRVCQETTSWRTWWRWWSWIRRTNRWNTITFPIPATVSISVSIPSFSITITITFGWVTITSISWRRVFASLVSIPIRILRALFSTPTIDDGSIVRSFHRRIRLTRFFTFVPPLCWNGITWTVLQT